MIRTDAIREAERRIIVPGARLSERMNNRIVRIANQKNVMNGRMIIYSITKKNVAIILNIFCPSYLLYLLRLSSMRFRFARSL